ncbi:(p)ppGpp synthetase, partial [Achromatium sp. WMS2]
VLVDTVADCYAALGIAHGLWQHIPGEFDDYIATPKANFYQSIHTAVAGPESGMPVEIQIRTHAMHQHAELGVAAHWRYKENAGHNPELEKRILSMRHWLEKKTETTGTGDDDSEQVNSEFIASQIYVLTPKNKVIELPKGSTALDFAYAIHSEVGNSCRGAKVDGKLIPLTQPLESGQTVEIIKVKSGMPSRDWLIPHLGYLHTAQARNRVRHWFRQQDFSQHLADGRVLLEKELTRLGSDRHPSLEHLAPKFNFKSFEDLLAAIGRNEISPLQIINLLKAKDLPAESTPEPVIHQHAPAANVNSKHSSVIVEGIGDLLTSMAGCCKPVPYDNLIGYITLGRGITVHRHDCNNVLQLPQSQRDRLVKVRWRDMDKQNTADSYAVGMLVVAEDRKGLLRDLLAVIAAEDISVSRLNSTSYKGIDTAKLRFTLEIESIKQFERLLGKVMQVPSVLEARRDL